MKLAVPLLAFFIAIAAMYLIMQSGVQLEQGLMIPFAVFCILGIIICSGLGLFDKSFMKYVLYSTIIQFFYFLLDVSTALLIGKSVWFAILQFLNFMLAGGLFAIVMTILYSAVRKDEMPEYAGLYDRNQLLIVALAVCCLALGGMPGFNIFVGEFLIYSSLFTVHPALTLGAVFAGLICFIFYFRICYTLMVRKSDIAVPLPMALETIVMALSILVVGLGVVPHVLLKVLEVVT